MDGEREAVAPDPVTYMAEAAASEVGREYKAAAVELLDVSAGQVVADMGCGPGTDLPSLRATVAGPLSVIGLDASAAMIAEARRRTGSLDGVHLARGDVQRLPLADGVLDRLRTDRVLQHVTDPPAALAEFGRVLRPQGLAVFSEPDWHSLSVDSADGATGALFRDYVTDRVVRNSDMGRALPRLAGAVGFTVRDVVAHVAVFRSFEPADRILGLTRVTHRAVGEGRMAAEARRAWLGELRRAAFTATLTILTVRVAPGARSRPSVPSSRHGHP